MTGLHAGVERAATTIWADDGSPLPTADHPVVAVVLTPKSGTGPTWVFPFNRPAPPGPGDNQALAIVTRDGGTAYDVSFALVWATKDTVLNRNSSYALASCRACKAVAIAFQVVLVVGEAHVVAPQNLAAAVGYHCYACVTEALAQQLVLTVPHRLTGTTLHRLQTVWARVIWFEHHLKGLTFAQVHAAIVSFERQIVAIVRPDLLAPAPAPSTTPSAAPTADSGAGTATDGPTPAASTAPSGASDSGSGSTTTSTESSSSSPSSSTSDSSSPSSTASPSPSST
jgi:putative peptide zinc metalloprotease protein